MTNMKYYFSLNCNLITNSGTADKVFLPTENLRIECNLSLDVI